MRSTKGQLVVAAVAMAVAAGLLGLKGLPPSMSVWRAVGQGDTRRVERSLAWGADVNARDYGGQTPIFDAELKEVALVLVAHGADVRARGPKGETPLHRAAYFGRTGVVKVLVESGADVNAVDESGQTALHEVASAWPDIWHNGTWVPTGPPSTEVVELLVMHGADVRARDRRGRTALAVALEGGFRDVIDCLRRSGGTE